MIVMSYSLHMFFFQEVGRGPPPPDFLKKKVVAALDPKIDSCEQTPQQGRAKSLVAGKCMILVHL
jgi:hypothetical protein